MIRIFSRTVVCIFFKIFYRHKVYGKENVPKGAAIIAANHCSFYDPPVIGISSPCKVYFLARTTLFNFKPFGWLLKQLATYPVSRGKGNTDTFKKAYFFLKSGEKIVIFPEGRRSSDGAIRDGLLGTGVLVVRSKALVVPAYIHGTYGIWNTKRKFPKLFGKTACVFGKPLDFSKLYEMEDRKAAQKLIVSSIMGAIRDLQKWYLEEHEGKKKRKEKRI